MPMASSLIQMCADGENNRATNVYGGGMEGEKAPHLEERDFGAPLENARRWNARISLRLANFSPT